MDKKKKLKKQHSKKNVSSAINSASVSSPTTQNSTSVNKSKTISIDSTSEGHSSLVNKDIYADLFFTLSTGDTVAAHQCIVSVRCPNLLTKAVKKSRKKKNVTFLDIDPDDNISEDSLVRVLTYLYTGKVDLSTLKPVELIIHLMRAAQVYAIERILQISEQYLQNNVNLSNIYKLLRVSNELQVKRAKDLLLDFCARNPAVVSNVEGVKELGIELFQEVVMLLQKPNDRQIPSLEVTQPDTSVDDFRRLFDNRKQSGDISFIIESVEVKAHRAILAGKSSKLFDAIENAEKTKMGDVVRLPLSTDSFLTFLRWAYFGSADLDPLSATQLLGFSKQYNLPTLTKLSQEIVRNNINNITAIPILEIAFSMDDNPSLKQELTSNSINYVVSNLRDIDLTYLSKPPTYQDSTLDVLDPRVVIPGRIAIDILLALQRHMGGSSQPKKKPKKPKTPKPAGLPEQHDQSEESDHSEATNDWEEPHTEPPVLPSRPPSLPTSTPPSFPQPPEVPSKSLPKPLMKVPPGKKGPPQIPPKSLPGVKKFAPPIPKGVAPPEVPPPPPPNSLPPPPQVPSSFPPPPNSFPPPPQIPNSFPPPPNSLPPPPNSLPPNSLPPPPQIPSSGPPTNPPGVPPPRLMTPPPVRAPTTNPVPLGRSGISTVTTPSEEDSKKKTKVSKKGKKPKN